MEGGGGIVRKRYEVEVEGSGRGVLYDLYFMERWAREQLYSAWVILHIITTLGERERYIYARLE
jgi:hypothetical protein